MPHNLTNLFQTKVLTRLYEQYVWESQTSWMGNNVSKVGATYKGGKYVEIYDLSVQGMADYDRNLGYVTGYAGGEKKEYMMEIDRGRRFLVDFIDNDETGFILSATNILKRYFTDFVIPELDAYRIHKLHAIVAAENASAVMNDDIDAAKITETLADDITTLRDAYGPGVRYRIIMSPFTQAYFGREWIHNLDYVTAHNGMVNTKIKGVDGNPLSIMPSSRLYTKYKFLDGTTSGQEEGGFVVDVAGGAKAIKWIIVPETGPVALMKQDKIRIFGPDQYQPANSWAIDHRIFHDLLMLPNDVKASIIRTGDIKTDND